MAISSNALFSYLLEDVSPYLRSQTLDLLLAEEATRPVAEAQGRLEAAALSITQSFYKKFVDTTHDDAEVRSWSKFLDMNSRCQNFDTVTSGIFKDRSQLQSWDDMLFGEFRKVLHQALYPSSDIVYDYDEIFDRGRHGPGAAVFSDGGDSYTKTFSCKGSSTSEFLVRHFVCRASQDSRWVEALSQRREQYGDPAIVEGSRLSFVPKSRDTMRSICVEPTYNMFYQLGLGSLFEDRLISGFGIDLMVQPDHNRWLTRLGSIDGSFGTIDLSSASDTISLSLLERILDPHLFGVIKKLRSRTTTYKGKSVELHMVSTMGNGFTFPLQTMLFASVVVAVYNILGIRVQRPDIDDAGNFGVFGDDIICRREAYDKICYLLGRLGFIVNTAKSFNEGPFRESCGQDWFSGTDIRGVYVKTLQSRQDIFVLINRLNDFTARTDINLSRTVGYLLRFVPVQPVPLGENDDAGIKIPLSMLKDRKVNKHVQSIMYYADRARPALLRFNHDVGKILVPRGSKRRLYNPLGVWLSFLAGWVDCPPSWRSAKTLDGISVRLNTTIYQRRRCVSPNWDFTAICSAPKAVHMARRLADAIESNLYYSCYPEG